MTILNPQILIFCKKNSALFVKYYFEEIFEFEESEE